MIEYLDFFILCLACIWYYIYYYVSELDLPENLQKYVDYETTYKIETANEDEVFVHYVIAYRLKYNFDYFVGFVSLVVWVKLILMLRLTKTFGPMITIIANMMGDLGTFMVLWALLLCLLACFGILAFGELDSFSNFQKILVVLFETSMGNWLMSIYDGLSLGDEVGEIYHLTVVLLNMILMLNLVIAILSETYGRLAR